jgi:hypothetical protein
MAVVNTTGPAKRNIVCAVSLDRWRLAVDFDLERLRPASCSGSGHPVPNHISFLDSAFLMLHVPRNISFVGKAEYMDSGRPSTCSRGWG